MLPESDWLHIARRLSVGMRVRVRHRHETRSNMTVGNERDRWWAYCQRCHEGGVVTKEHVILSGPLVHDVYELTVPPDSKPIAGSEFEIAVGRFLAAKGMMFPYLPPLHYSESRKRVLVPGDTGDWHGRDLTGRSMQKWLHYGSKFVGLPGPITVLTEDLFSMYKLRFALRGRHLKDVCVCCTLGSGIHNSSVLALKEVKHLVWAYDGDAAGDDGYQRASKRLRPFGAKQSRVRPPDGLDPKDMDCQQLRDLIKEVL